MAMYVDLCGGNAQACCAPYRIFPHACGVRAILEQPIIYLKGFAVVHLPAGGPRHSGRIVQ